MTLDINYYRKPKPSQPAKAASKTRGYSSWLRGETADMYSQRLQKDEGLSGKELQQRLYMDHRTVGNETREQLIADGVKTFNLLKKSQHPEVQKLLDQGGFDQVKLMKDVPHYGYLPLAEMRVTYPDGARSVLQLVASNFPAKVIPGKPGDEGFQFKDVPRPQDGITVPSQYSCVARKVDPATGLPGDIDPVFTPNGIAFSSRNVADLAREINRIGVMTIKAERALRIQAAKDELQEGGWSMRKPVDPRQINMDAGIRQGNVICPQFLPYMEKPAPAAKREQEPTMKKAM